MSKRTAWLMALAAGVALCAVSTYLLVQEHTVLSERTRALQATVSAIERGEFAEAVTSSREYFELHPRNPDPAAERRALALYDQALTRWLAENLAAEDANGDELVRDFEKTRREVRERWGHHQP